MALATVVALVAAATYALATALLHRSAQLVGAAARAGSGVGRFVSSNVRHPVWILGMVTEGVGFALHALALHAGPITLVQPLLVSGLVFALPIRQLLDRRRPEMAELAWAAVLAVGLVVFLLAATPSEGPSNAPDRIPTILATILVAAGMLGSGVLGLRWSGRRAAAVLGFGAGLGFAAVAGLLKAVTDEASHHGLALFANWPVYALVPAGFGGLLLNQLAFRVAPLRHSLPTMSTVDPLVSLLIGAAVFDEPFRHSAPAVAGEVLGLVLIVAPIIALTRREPDPGYATQR
ncbi:MAG TPA: DMT family transporter [Acidimicrobiales bacterium]|nr:DMT family transporter [Acidimicrobiales bacterium]